MYHKYLLLVMLSLGLFLCFVGCTNKSVVNNVLIDTTTPTSPFPPTATLVYSSQHPTPIVFVPLGTFTPVPAVICPNMNSSITHLNIGPISETFDQSYEEPILNFLNAGGSVDILEHELQNLMLWFNVSKLDLTNDSVPEVIVEANQIYVFGCLDGKYRSLLVIGPVPTGYSQAIEVNEDLNLDGVPELLISRSFGGPIPSMQVELLEWDGKQFRNLFAQDNVCSRSGIINCIWDGVPEVLNGKIELGDNENGTKNVIISGNLPTDTGVDTSAPTDIFTWTWNGSEFILSSILSKYP